MFDESGFGGGYIQSPGKSDSPQKNSSQSAKSKNRPQNILPCTIAQLLAVPDNEDTVTLSLGKASTMHTFVNVCVVGRVNYVEELTTNVSYKIKDYSGPEFKVIKWKSNIDADTNENVIEVGRYVKVFGKLNVVEGKKQLIAFSIDTIKSYNCITTHMLEVLHSRIYLQSYQETPGNDSGNQGMDVDTGMSLPGFNVNGMDNTNGLTSVQKAVHDVIIAAPNEDGCSVEHVFQTVKNTTKDAIKKALDFLSSEGHIYPTIDDDHYKATL